MKSPNRLLGVFDGAVNGGFFIATALIIFIMLAITFDVITRYTGHPQIWTVEVTEYTLLYICFLGTAWVLKQGGHVKVDLLTNRLNSRTQALLGIIGSVIGIVTSLVLVIYGSVVTWDYFLAGQFQNTHLMPPSAPLYAVIPIGSLLLLIQFIRTTYDCVNKCKEPLRRIE